MHKDDELLLANLREAWQRAQNQGRLSHSGFLDARQQALAASLPKQLPGCAAHFYGGYAEAERRLMLFWGNGLPAQSAVEYLVEHPEQNPLAVLSIRQKGLKLSHRDYLGALLALGIKRQLVGDLLVHEQGCDILILQSIADFLVQEYRQVGRHSITPALLPIAALHITRPQLEQKRAVIASPRLDNVAAALFHLARGKAAEAIAAGIVLRNGLPALKPDAHVHEGDTISLRGKGKARVLSFESSGKKGRLAMRYDWYI